MILSLLLLISPNAQASGYYFSDVGVRAFSRGGAYVVGASDLVALWYNPATLVNIPDGQGTVSVAGVGQYIRFDRKDYPGEGPDGTDLINKPIENEAPPYIIPHLGIAHSLGLKNTKFAAGLYPPYAPDISYPNDGPQRYMLTDSVVIQTFTGVSAAHTIADWVTIGGGLSWNVLIVEQELAVSLWTNWETEERADYDVGFMANGKDMFAIGGNLGLMIQPPSRAWAVGGMVQAPTSFQTKGEMTADFKNNAFYELDLIQDRTARDKDVSLAVAMPLIAKAGALVRPTDHFEVEANFVYEGWGSISDITVTDINMAISTSLGPVEITDDVVLPANLQDSWSVRLGGEGDLGKHFIARAGGLYETGAVPPEKQSASMVDGNKIGFGLGGTWKAHERFDVDLGIFQSFIPSQTINNSEVRQIVVDPFTGEVSDGRVVGDADLDSRISMVGGSVSWYLGKRMGRRDALSGEATE